jgi:hypothetical protein
LIEKRGGFDRGKVETYQSFWTRGNSTPVADSLMVRMARGVGAGVRAARAPTRGTKAAVWPRKPEEEVVWGWERCGEGVRREKKRR